MNRQARLVKEATYLAHKHKMRRVMQGAILG